jgi:membrane-bound lytic murein transglycosylase B
VSTTGWLRTAAVAGAAAMILVYGGTAGLGVPVLLGVPPPAGAAVPDVDTHLRGRPAEQLYRWATALAPTLGIPVLALEAYAYAAKVAQIENPKCHVGWTTLAGIGMVESKHGSYHGASIIANGDVRPPIRGARLDGRHGTMRIVDPAEDSRDGTHRVVRAMGPMQFIPATWRLYGVDAHNDGVASPDNIDDAALSAAGYLCFRGGDLAISRGWTAALRAYNDSDLYARAVRGWAAAYARGRSH